MTVWITDPQRLAMLIVAMLVAIPLAILLEAFLAGLCGEFPERDDED